MICKCKCKCKCKWMCKLNCKWKCRDLRDYMYGRHEGKRGASWLQKFYLHNPSFQYLYVCQQWWWSLRKLYIHNIHIIYIHSPNLASVHGKSNSWLARDMFPIVFLTIAQLYFSQLTARWWYWKSLDDGGVLDVWDPRGHIPVSGLGSCQLLHQPWTLSNWFKLLFGNNLFSSSFVIRLLS